MVAQKCFEDAAIGLQPVGPEVLAQLPAGLLGLDRNLPKGSQSLLSIKPPRPSRA